jgi:hypothetical protein
MRDYSLLCCSLVLFSFSMVEAQNCKDFVVLDTVSSRSGYSSYERVKDVVCKKEIKDESSAMDVGVKAGIPIPVLEDVFKLDFDGKFDSKNSSHWLSQFCSSHFSEVETKLSEAHLSKIFSDNARKTVQDCLMHEPVYGYFEPTSTADGFSFTFSVQGTEKLKGAIINDRDAVSECDPKNPFGLNWYYKEIGDVDISGQKKAFACGWNSSKLVQLTLRLENQGDRAYQLEPIIPRPIDIVKLTDKPSFADLMFNGSKVALEFTVANNNASWELGSTYRVWYEKGAKTWHANGKVAKQWGGYLREGADGTTTCQESPVLQGSHPLPDCYSPKDNVIVIWQGAYQFDGDGKVYGGGPDPVGHITLLPD